ncbi:MAG: hypothetical protein C5B55_09475, partial [Blastocatellia bacterium]
MVPRRELVLSIVLLTTTLCGLTHAQNVTTTLKGTVSAIAEETSTGPELLPDVTLTLVNRDLSTSIRTTTSDASGNFIFRDLPAGNYKLIIEAKGFPRAEKEISLPAGRTSLVEIVLTPSVSEAVTVRQEEGLLSAGDTVTSNTVRAEKLEELPMRSDNYQGALPLTPGIVRDL